MKKKEALTKIERFCLDAYTVNQDADTAYLLSRRNTSTAEDPDIIHRMALRWLRSQPVKEYLIGRGAIAIHRGETCVSDESPRNRDKAAIVEELNTLANITKDPKQKTEILMKLADLQQMKKDKTDEEDNTIHYYLPLSCQNCELYMANKIMVNEDGGGLQ